MAADGRIGTTLGSYRIVALIGRGGMGAVYEAHDSRLDRTVALKVLPVDLAADAKFRARFDRESRAAALIDHPHVIPIYEAGEIDGVLFLAMRLVRGHDLGAIIGAEGQLSSSRTWLLVAQVAAGLDAAHAAGLVHRDVKPGNILIDHGVGPGDADHAYLADFGLIKRTLAYSGGPETGGLVGTIAYAAPEQIRGEPVTPSTDIYALGCVVYECLTGAPPFVRPYEAAVLWAHLHDDPPAVSAARPDLPVSVDDVVARAMAKDPAARYGSSADLADALGVALGRATTEPPVHGAGGRDTGSSRPRSRPWRRRVVALAAVLALSAAGLTWVLHGNGHHEPTPLAIDTINRLDPDTGAITRSVAVGRRPTALAAAPDGTLWVANFDDETLTRIDGGDGSVTTLGIGFHATGLAATADAVWVADGFAGVLLRVDPARSTVVGRIAIDVGVADLATTPAGEVWAVNPLTAKLARIDPKSNTLTSAIDVGGSPTAIVASDDVAWVADRLQHIILRVDLVAGTVTAHVGVGFAPERMALDAGGLWVTGTLDDQLARIDTSTPAVRTSITVGDGPTGVAAAHTVVWVANGLAGTLARVDAATGQLSQTVAVGHDPDALIATPDGIWFTVHDR